ncbi:hypothetical protein NMY22_g19452 [Coprinellus aureogranulatus]|nr:hypothetical protein NMY22_g19452 [Coprinellus aureogranulatus]
MPSATADNVELNIAVVRLMTQIHMTLNRLLDMNESESTASLIAAVPDISGALAALDFPIGVAGGDDSDAPCAVDPVAPSAAIVTDHEVRNPHKWYVILVGRSPGVFRGSNGLMSNIGGISKNVHEIHDSREAAIPAYVSGVQEGKVLKVEFIESREVIRNAGAEAAFVHE